MDNYSGDVALQPGTSPSPPAAFSAFFFSLRFSFLSCALVFCTAGAELLSRGRVSDFFSSRYCHPSTNQEGRQGMEGVGRTAEPLDAQAFCSSCGTYPIFT